MLTPEPTVKPVKYRVSCVPEDHPDASLFTLRVEYREAGQWSVTNGPRFYAADGTKSFGPRWEDGREPVTDEERAADQAVYEEWLTVYRFDEDTALRIAREQAPLMRYGNYTVQDALNKPAETATGLVCKCPTGCGHTGTGQ